MREKEKDRVKGRVVGSGRRECRRGGRNLAPRRGRDALPSLSSVSFAADSDGRGSCVLRVNIVKLSIRDHPPLSVGSIRFVDFANNLRETLVFHAVVHVVFKFQKVLQRTCDSSGVACWENRGYHSLGNSIRVGKINSWWKKNQFK